MCPSVLLFILPQRQPPRAPPRRRAPPLYSWRLGEPGVCCSGRGGGGGPRGLGGSGGGGGIGSSSSSSSYELPVSRHCRTSPRSRQSHRPRRCLTQPAGPLAASPGSARSCPPTRPRPSAPVAATAATPPAASAPAVGAATGTTPAPAPSAVPQTQPLRRHPGGWDAPVQN